MEKISVIIPVYNAEKTLGKCIESVINQTYNDLDIVLINDGSTDLSPKICEYYSNIDRRIRLFNQSNHGLDYSRRVGVNNSQSEYLAFIDSDDFIPNNFIEQLYHVIKSANCLLAVCEVQCIFMDGSIKKLVNIDLERIIDGKTEVMKSLIPQNGGIANYFCNKLFHKSLFNDLEYCKYRKFEDVSLMYQIVYKTDRIVYTPDTYYCYVLNQYGITGSYRGDFKNFDLIDANRDKYLFIKSHFTELSGLSLHQLVNALLYYFISGVDSDLLTSKVATDLLKEVIDYAKEEKYWRVSIKNYLKLYVVRYFRRIIRVVYKAR